MTETNEPKSEPYVELFGDLPPIHSDEFGEFLAQWHADHNGIDFEPETLIKPDPCTYVD